MDESVVENTYGWQQSFVDGLNTFYTNYVVTTADQSFQVFQSFTYGEMAIACLLVVAILLFAAKWIWEVIR